MHVHSLSSISYVAGYLAEEKQVGNDQEKAQSERDSHSKKTEVEKNS